MTGLNLKRTYVPRNMYKKVYYLATVYTCEIEGQSAYLSGMQYAVCCMYCMFVGPMKQQTSITVYRLPTKENKLPFSVSSVFRIFPYIYCILKRQHIYRYFDIYIDKGYISIYQYLRVCIYTLSFKKGNGKRKPRWFSLTNEIICLQTD
jgi:hypothetical protein